MQPVIKRYFIGLFISAFFSSVGFAGKPPALITFEDGEQFSLALSGLNFNRVYVEGEKIIKTSYPKGAFIVDLSEKDNPSLKESSVYLKPMFEAPLTIYFTTDKDHHFSLTVQSDDSSGKTVRMSARNNASKYVSHAVHDVSDVEAAMQAMQNGEAPKDFTLKPVLSRPFYVKKDILVKLLKRYEGERLTGYVYQLENKASHPVELTTNVFDKRNAESLNLSEDELQPAQVAYLYGLYRNEG